MIKKKNAYLLGVHHFIPSEELKKEKKWTRAMLGFRTLQCGQSEHLSAHVERWIEEGKIDAHHPDSKHRPESQSTQIATINRETVIPPRAHRIHADVSVPPGTGLAVSTLYFIRRSNALDSKLDSLFFKLWSRSQLLIVKLPVTEWKDNFVQAGMMSSR